MTKRTMYGRRSIAVAVFVSASFLVQYFNWILGTYIPYGLFLCVAAALLACGNDLNFKNLKNGKKGAIALLKELDILSLSWIPAVLLIGISCFTGGLGPKEIIDVFTYVICVWFLAASGDNETVSNRAFKVIKFFAVYYAVSVWIQFLLPPVYSLYLGILPQEVSSFLSELQNEHSSYAGFSTNSGFTAAHIVAGFLVVFTKQHNENMKRCPKDWATLVFLAVTLLLTGKRAHLMFMIAVMCVIYIISATGKKRISRLRSLAVILAVGIVIGIIAIKFFTFIPVVKRIAETVSGLLSGEDITTGRTKMYAYAWKLFLENPLFGIGWSRYPDVMVGEVTKITSMDTHNIYLQLLAELGSVGFLLVIIPMCLTLYNSFVQLSRLQKNSNRSVAWESALLFSIAYQVFFLLYGFTGNPFFDYNCVIMYFFAATIGIISKRKLAHTDVSSEPKHKTGIVTFHFAHNQGAVLQCYALQEFLRKLGHDSYVIDYRPSYHTVRYSAWKNPFLFAVSNWKKNGNKRLDRRIIVAARGFARGAVADIKQLDRASDIKFNRFCERYLNQTKTYNSLKELRWDPPSMDAYVSGSDQLWNPDLLNCDFDAAYFMDFGSKSAKRITYAVSLKEHYTDKQLEEMKKLTANIDGLCIREENEDFYNAMDREVKVCIDPTLLLDESDYRLLETERKVAEPYVFVYGFETSESINDAVAAVSKEYALKIVNGSPKRVRLNMECEKVRNYSPDEFLSYIRHADYVITNSFHGTAFSVIYKKKFAVIAHTTRGRRMTELLGKLGLSQRLWQSPDCAWREDIDYSEPDKKLALLRDEARGYLEQNLPR